MSSRHWDPEQPYNRLAALPPLEELETKVVLKQCVEARARLAELKQAAELIPNQAMLVNTLPLLEAQASSEIENIVTTTDRLFQHADADHSADAATKEALRYRHALLEGAQVVTKRPLGTGMAEMTCSRIKGVEMRVRHEKAAIENKATREIVYTPPVGEPLLRDLLANWERFIHEERDLDPLVRMAIGHYQFEAIHPFSDGNGRTGRVLNSLFLIEENLLTLPILFMSRYINQTKMDYNRLLLEVTCHQAWEPWTLYMLKAVEETATWTTAKVGAIRALAKHTAEHVRRRCPKLYSRDLVDVIFEQPYCRIADLDRAGVAKRQTASRYLKALVETGILEEQLHGRDKLFVHPKLISLLGHENHDFTPYE